MGSLTKFLPSFAALPIRQRWASAAFLIGLVAFVLFLGLERRAEQMDVVRRQFHLPQAIPFAAFSMSDGKARWPQLTGVVQFSDGQYRDYVGSLDNGEVWGPIRLEYRGVSAFHQFSPEAFRWRSVPPAPRYAGDPIGRWGFASEPRVYALTDALYFCYGVITIAPEQSVEPPRHRAVACRDLRTDEATHAIVKAALDAETRTLHWIIH